MGKICVCGGCSNSRLSGHRLHRFPSRKIPLFMSWVRFVQVKRKDFTAESVSNNSVVCSAHFRDDDYNESDLYQHKMGFRCRQKVRLKLTAVPSVQSAGCDERGKSSGAAASRGRASSGGAAVVSGEAAASSSTGAAASRGGASSGGAAVVSGGAAAAAAPDCSCNNSKALSGAANCKLQGNGIMTTATSQAEGEEVIPTTADEDLGPDVMGDGLSVQHHLLTTVNHFTQCGFRQLVTCRPTVIPADVQQLVLIKEGTPEEWKPIVDQQNPEPLNMKVEEEELWTSLEEDQLNVKEETDATRFSATAVPPKSESDEEKPLFSQLHQHQMEVGDLPTSSSTDQMILSASCGDDCEGAGTTRNPDLKTDDDDSNSSETEDSENYEEDEDSESELKDSSKSWSNIEEEDSNWKESRTPESGLNPANKSFSCSKSGTEFVDSQSFLRHVTSHSRIKSSSCFGNKRSLKVKKVHKTQKTFSCDDCGKKFTRKDNLNTHLRFHKGVKPFSCEICGRRFNQKSNLVTHKRIHTGEKPFACDFCGQRFNQKSGLNSHMTSHIGQKPFACEVCGQTFCRKGHLKSHMRIHTGEKCFECDVCGQKFSLKSSLNAHTTIHTGQKPFSCDVCGQTFRQKNTLGNHMRIHTGQKPFGCKVCGQMFRQKAHVENHLRIHTRNSNSSDDATSI